MLQDKMIGGEQADNVALKEKRNRKRSEAEKKRQKLTGTQFVTSHNQKNN